jgi:glycosyltransferase involved in cell wall biosynthesis
MTSDSGHATITAVIPAFNEEKTIGGIVQKTKQYVNEVVVVDDGSTDATQKIAHDSGATVLRHTRNMGYGTALATGFRYFKGNGAKVLVVLDADGQHNPDEIPKLIAPVTTGRADIVIGSRFIDGCDDSEVPAYRKFGIGVVNRAWKLASGDDHSDTQCGFRAYSRDAVEKIEIKETNMSASLEILDKASANQLRIVEVPVSVSYDGETSTKRPGRHGMELVNYVLRKITNEHPLLIFGTTGMLVATVGLGFGIYSMNSYFESRFLPFGPTLISGILIYVGTLMIFGGLILNSIQSLASRLETKNAK